MVDDRCVLAEFFLALKDILILLRIEERSGGLRRDLAGGCPIGKRIPNDGGQRIGRDVAELPSYASASHRRTGDAAAESGREAAYERLAEIVGEELTPRRVGPV